MFYSTCYIHPVKTWLLGQPVPFHVPLCTSLDTHTDPYPSLCPTMLLSTPLHTHLHAPLCLITGVHLCTSLHPCSWTFASLYIPLYAPPHLSVSLSTLFHTLHASLCPSAPLCVPPWLHIFCTPHGFSVSLNLSVSIHTFMPPYIPSCTPLHPFVPICTSLHFLMPLHTPLHFCISSLLSTYLHVPSGPTVSSLFPSIPLCTPMLLSMLLHTLPCPSLLYVNTLIGQGPHHGQSDYWDRVS